MSKTLSDGRVQHDAVVGQCPKSECGGDLVALTGWSAWTDEKCLKCGASWRFQAPRKIDEIAALADAEKNRREKSRRENSGRGMSTLGDLVLIEDVLPSEWGMSFAGSNPAPEHFVRCTSREDAVRLKGLVEALVKNASRPALTEEDAARITSSLDLDVGPDFARFMAVQTKVTAALMRASRGDYRTGNVAAPKASKEDPLAGLPQEERRRIVAAAEKGFA